MNFGDKLKVIFQEKGLRNRLLFVAFALMLSRLLAAIPVPGVNAAKLAVFFSGNQFFGFLNIFSGGGLSTLSVVMLGVGPFITSVIIMQILTMISPKLKSMYQEEGEAGRNKFNQISRIITVPIAFLQGLGLLLTLERAGVISNLGILGTLVNLLVITAGSILLMWIGEMISEFGIGNGTSLIIFAGIIARLPTAIAQAGVTFSAAEVPTYLMLLVFSLVVIYGVVFISQAQRPVPVTYAKKVIGSKVTGGISTYIPLRVNQAGVMPIIFGTSMLIFPEMIFNFLSQAHINTTIRSIAGSLNNLISNGWVYAIIYFLLVFVFTYFYTAIIFDPDQIAKNLQQSGAFVPGVRPGQSTSDYLANVLTRITLVGALFLAVLAVLPVAVKSITGITSFAVGGTALLIVVEVIIDLINKIEAQITMREY